MQGPGVGDCEASETQVPEIINHLGGIPLHTLTDFKIHDQHDTEITNHVDREKLRTIVSDSPEAPEAAQHDDA